MTAPHSCGSDRKMKGPVKNSGRGVPFMALEYLEDGFCKDLVRTNVKHFEQQIYGISMPENRFYSS